MVEQRRRSCDLIRMVVDQQTEVAVMPVRVADDRIQHQHIVQRIHILRAELLIIFPYRSQAAVCDNPSDWQERIFLAGEQLAGGAELTLPLGQTIWNCPYTDYSALRKT